MIILTLVLFSSSLEAITNCSDQTQIPESECQALVALYNSTEGPNWSDSQDNDWNVTNEPCHWQGVRCRGNSIVKINRVNKNLNGTLPDLSALTQLKTLFLSNNQLTGRLPEFGFRHPLQRLNLENNQFVGDIPASFNQLSSLSSLKLGYNKLTVNMEDIPLLNMKSFDWVKTQTIPPSLVEASALSSDSLRLDWTPILYTGDGGYYQIECDMYSGGPYSITIKTVDKSVSSQIVNELLPATRYYCAVRTFTPAHGKQHNDLISELSEEVSVVTLEVEEVSLIPLENKCATQTDILPAECEPQVSLHDRTEDDSSEADDSSESIEVISSGTFDSSKVVDGPRRYYLTVNKIGLGSIKGKNIYCGIDCTQSYLSGTYVTLTAIPVAGYSFAGWSDDCDTSGKVWMISERNCTATFYRQRSFDEVSKALSVISEIRIDLGSSMIGQPIEKTLSVAETGVVPLEVSQATLSGPDAVFFSVVSGEPPFVIPAEGPAHSLTVQCVPEMAGFYETTLTLTTDDETQPTINYLLICEGFDETTLSYDSNPLPGETLNFESVVGLPGVAQIEIFEERGMSGLEIYNSDFSGEHAKDFSIVNGTSSFAIPEEGSYTLTVRCLPDKPGVHLSQLILTTNDPNQNTINYPLNCVGLAAGYSSIPSPDNLIFVGSSSVEDMVITQLVIEETGTVALDVTDSSLSGTHAGDFNLTNGAPFSIAEGGESHTVTISCTPSATGERTAILHFTTNDPQQPDVSYPLACTGTTSSTNQPPTNITLSNEIISKNSVIGTLIGTLTTVDLDMDDDHFYTLDNDAGGRFKIVDNQLQVAVAPLSGDAPYLITVTTTDPAGSSVSKDFTLRFDDTNLRPTDIILSNNKVSENSVPGTRVGFLSTLDPNTDDEHHYVLDNNAEGRFKIVGNQLQVAEELPDLETKGGYLVTITSIDSGDLSFTKDFSLEAVQNESPTDIMLSDNIVGLDNVAGTVVGVLSTVDSEDNYHTYALYNNAGGRFKIIGNELQVATDSLNTAGHYLIIVITTDRGGLSFSKDFVIEIDTTNHLPTDIILSDTTVPDTSVVGTPVGKLLTLDSDPDDSHSYTLEDSQGQFKIVGDELQVATELWEAPLLYPLTITTTDASGESLSKDFTLDIYENQLPTDIILSGETVDKNSVTEAWVGTLSSVDPNEDDKHGYVLDDDAGNRFKIVDNELRIGDWVDFESGTDYFITVTSTDQGGLSISKEFILQVCEGAHAVYTIEDKRLHIPFIDMPIFDSETKQPTGEVKVLKGDLAFLTGIEDFKGTPENMEVLETVSTVSPCHALYQEGTLYIPYADVPSILVLPGDVVIEGPTQIFETTLEQLPEDPSWFHLKSYQLRQ